MSATIMFKFENGWNQIGSEEREKVFTFSEGYKRFLDKGKTERECARQIMHMAEAYGFLDLNKLIEEAIPLKAGTKIYLNNKGKSVALFVIGKAPLSKGMNIIGSHIDVSRLDLKPFPLYEDEDLALMKTHYYGAIKKYQWTAIPLALHGFIMKKSGQKVEIIIGEEEDDPVFYISDLLPHLSKDQNERKLSEGISGEDLNVIFGSIPCDDIEVENRVKYNIIKIINEKYDIDEDDFLVAEIEILPSGKARDVGIDRSLVGAYGNDDRVCAYTSLQAILEIEEPEKTVAVLFVDKEEVGNYGNTGMESRFFENAVAELIALQEKELCDIMLRRAMANSKILSGDVGAGFDPNFPDVMDKRNSAYLGKGVLVAKYTGAKGKSGSNDANAEFLAEVRKIFNDNSVVWQTGDLGKVDQGGGGTIAYVLAGYGAEVVDCGVPVISMHAPMELVSKMDIYMTYKAYKSFLKFAL